MFGESAEEVVERERRGDVGEEVAQARARKTGAAPSEKEADGTTWTKKCLGVGARDV